MTPAGIKSVQYILSTKKYKLGGQRSPRKRIGVALNTRDFVPLT